MSDEKRYDHRTLEEIEADLEERRKDHQFISTEEVLEWNANRPGKPLPDSHWTVKREKDRKKLEAMIGAIHKSYEYRLLMGAAWKKLAVKQHLEALGSAGLFGSTYKP